MHPLLQVFLGGLALKKIYNWFSTEESGPLQKRIFISHSWKNGSYEYTSFIKKLECNEIKFYNHSIPIHKAFNETDRNELIKKFRKQMTYCSKIFILINQELEQNSFVKEELKIAESMEKEIIAVKPYNLSLIHI